MKITPEIKSIIFHQYHGQYVDSDKGRCRLRDSDFIDTLNWIKLKHISDITDEDAVGLAKIVFSKESHNSESGKWYIDTYFIKNKLENTTAKTYLSVCQYLISKGYDVPQYLLGNKTLKEAGLAIYE